MDRIKLTTFVRMANAYFRTILGGIGVGLLSSQIWTAYVYFGRIYPYCKSRYESFVFTSGDCSQIDSLISFWNRPTYATSLSIFLVIFILTFIAEKYAVYKNFPQRTYSEGWKRKIVFQSLGLLIGLMPIIYFPPNNIKFIFGILLHLSLSVLAIWGLLLFYVAKNLPTPSTQKILFRVCGAILIMAPLAYFAVSINNDISNILVMITQFALSALVIWGLLLFYFANRASVLNVRKISFGVFGLISVMALGSYFVVTDRIPFFEDVLGLGTVFLMIMGTIFLVGLVKYIIDYIKKKNTRLAKWLMIWGFSLGASMIGLWLTIGYFQTPTKWPPSSCFTEDTLVWTPDGNRAISSLQVGDSVFALDPSSSRIMEVPVLDVYRSTRNEILLINGLLRVTPEHPMAIQNGEMLEWRDAGKLQTGDCLVDDMGSCVPVTSIKKDANEPTAVVNLSVAEPNTFYVMVGGSPILVHNKTYPLPPPQPPVMSWDDALRHIDNCEAGFLNSRTLKLINGETFILTGKPLEIESAEHAAMARNRCQTPVIFTEGYEKYNNYTFSTTTKLTAKVIDKTIVFNWTPNVPDKSSIVVFSSQKCDTPQNYGPGRLIGSATIFGASNSYELYLGYTPHSGQQFCGQIWLNFSDETPLSEPLVITAH